MKKRKFRHKQKVVSRTQVADLRAALTKFILAAERQCGLPPATLTAQDETIFKLLKPKQVSEMTGISAKTLANQRCSGRGMKFQKIGSRIYYSRADVVRYCEEHKFQNTSQYDVALGHWGTQV